MSEDEEKLRGVAYSGNIEWIKKLIKKGVDLNARGANGVTALHKAVVWMPHLKDKKFLEIVKLLVENGADVNVAENDHQVGILTGKIYFYSHPNKIWSAGGSLSLYRCNFSLIGYGQMDVGQYDTIKEVDHVTGSCLMIRNKVIDKVGVLDNNFNPYFGEDTDWCLRTKKKGYKIIYVPKAILWHHVIIKTTVNKKY